jgi:hypothetical protein
MTFSGAALLVETVILAYERALASHGIRLRNENGEIRPAAKAELRALAERLQPKPAGDWIDLPPEIDTTGDQDG